MASFTSQDEGETLRVHPQTIVMALTLQLTDTSTPEINGCGIRRSQQHFMLTLRLGGLNFEPRTSDGERRHVNCIDALSKGTTCLVISEERQP